MTWDAFLAETPLVAILRGLPPEDAPAIGDVLIEAGFVCAEVPLNSPEPLASIGAMRERFGGRMLIGAGTVLTPKAVREAASAGAEFIVAPNTDVEVLETAKGLGLKTMPGFFTPSEAFTALGAGADYLKLFPADRLGPDFIRALLAVLPPAAPVFAVGGVDEEQMQAYRKAGAAGFGFGSTLYKPGASPNAVAKRAHALVTAWQETRP